MFTLKPLPFDIKALEPHISAKTLEFHHGKHHQAYIDNLNKLIVGTEFEGLSLEEIIKRSAGDSDKAAIFNNAAQVYNHDFFWQSLSSAKEDREMSAHLQQILEEAFGSLDNFYEQFKAAGLTQFGSGWTWLVRGKNGLEIIKTANADTPIAHGLKPILTLDVWEHAYYLDYQNKRGDFLDVCLKQLINWRFATINIV